MLKEQTLSHLNQLKLFGMKQSLQLQWEQPQTFDLSFEERISLMVDSEWNYRHSKKIERLLSTAKLKQPACIEDIDYRSNRGLRKEDMSALITCQWIKEGTNLTLTGPTGVGKSWLACALGNQACRLGFSVAYKRFSRLLEELHQAKADGSYIKTLKQWQKIDLLILDDWGLERLTTEHRRDLLEIVEDRHGLKSLLITSQLPLSHWHEMIVDPTLADAILDRLLSKLVKLELKGESLRKAKNTLAA